VIGVILTGLLDDGTAGLDAVKRSGGIAVVQDPDDAPYPDMPLSAIDNVKVDYVVPLSKMGEVLYRLVTENQESGNPGASHIPRDVITEARIAQEALSDINIVETLGAKSPYGCPDCGGVLWEIKNGKPLRFRCNTGHAFTYRALLSEQTSNLERALWAAIRALEERSNMLGRMARQEKESGRVRSSADFEREMHISKGHAQALRDLLLKEEPPAEEPRRKQMEERSAA
jgi:two-component system chemotaxis response regulator CheB